MLPLPSPPPCASSRESAPGKTEEAPKIHVHCPCALAKSIHRKIMCTEYFCLVLPCPALPCFVLACLILPCLVLSYIALRCVPARTSVALAVACFHPKALHTALFVFRSSACFHTRAACCSLSFSRNFSSSIL